MPNPNDYASREEFLDVCIPAVIAEGKPHDAAVGQCEGMWNDKAVPTIDRAWSTLVVKSVELRAARDRGHREHADRRPYWRYRGTDGRPVLLADAVAASPR